MSLHAIWNRSAPLADPDVIGREARKRERDVEADASLQRLQALVLREAPEMAAGDAPSEGQEVVDRLVQQIQEEAESPADWRRLHNYLAVAIDRGNRQNLWSLIAPNPFLDLKRDPLLRDEAYFRRGSMFVMVRRHLATALHHLHQHEERWREEGPNTLAARRGGLVLASASLFGGLCNPHMLALLPEALRTTAIQRCGDQIWVDLRVPESIAPRLNLVGEDEALHRWCPDELTAALLAYFYQHHEQLEFPEAPGGNGSAQAKQVLRIIREVLKDLEIPLPSEMTPNQWGLGAWAALEREPGESIPAYLGEYALGRTPSCSLPVDRWVALLNQQVAPSATPVSAADEQGATGLSSVRPPTIRTETPATQAKQKDAQQVARHLLQAFQSPAAKKLTSAQCRNALEGRMESEELGNLVSAQLLAHWAIVLLTDGSSWHPRALAPSTVYGSYLAPIAQPIIGLLFTAESDDLRDFDSDEFEQLYEDVLQQSRWKDKSTPANALQEFHHFLSTQYGCPSLGTPVAQTTRGTPRVRALIVTEAEYQTVRGSIRSSFGHLTTTCENLEAALILGFRAGLRPAETLKLRLQDIFVGPTDTIITVRTNRYGTNKNRPSRRRIDLAALCPEDEYRWFSDHVDRLQASFAKSPQALLLTEAPNRDIPVTRDFLESQLQPVLRQCTGNPHILYYTLRHSALTRLHLRSEIPARDHQLHASNDEEPPDHCPVPSLTAGSPASMKRLHAVTAVAGHASPEMTLTTYLHGLELILYEKVRVRLPKLDASVYRILLEPKCPSISRFLKDQRLPNPASADVLRPRILQALPTEDHAEPTKQQVVPPPPVTGESPRPLTVADVQQIVTAHDVGHGLAVIARHHQADPHKCEAIIDAARRIAGIRSKKGRPRLITARRRDPEHNVTPVSPAPPPDGRDHQFALRMIEKIRPLLSPRGELGDIAPIIELFLQRVEANNSGVRFDTTKEAEPFVTLLAHITGDRGLIFGKHVFSQNSRLNATDQRSRWEKKLGIEIREHQKTLKREGGRHGKLLVSVKLLNDKGHLVSAHAYKYVLHLAAIALLSRDRIRIPGAVEATDSPPTDQDS